MKNYIRFNRNLEKYYITAFKMTHNSGAFIKDEVKFLQTTKNKFIKKSKEFNSELVRHENRDCIFFKSIADCDKFFKEVYEPIFIMKKLMGEEI